MSRRRTRPEDIRNPEHYFKKYVAMENVHQCCKQARIKEMELSLEAQSEHVQFTYEVAINREGELFARAEYNISGCDWIRNHRLLAAV